MFHINPKTGQTGECYAIKGQCPYSSEFHANTASEVRKIFEEKMGKDFLNSRKKSDSYLKSKSKGIFLGKYETLNEVIQKDSEEMEELGETFENMGEKLKEVNFFVKKFCLSRPRKSIPVELFKKDKIFEKDLKFLPDDLEISFQPSQYLGSQECTFPGCNTLERSFHTIVLKRGEKVLIINGLTSHLINSHHFFQGEGSIYRVSPKAISDFFKN